MVSNAISGNAGDYCVCYCVLICVSDYKLVLYLTIHLQSSHGMELKKCSIKSVLGVTGILRREIDGLLNGPTGHRPGGPRDQEAS